MDVEQRVPRVGHKKSRLGCAQCKKRHVKVGLSMSYKHESGCDVRLIIG